MLMTSALCLTDFRDCQIWHELSPILEDSEAPLDVIAFTTISLGLIYVGSCNEEVSKAIVFALMHRSESELGEPLSRLLPLGLGLLYLGKQVIEFMIYGLFVVLVMVVSFLNSPLPQEEKVFFLECDG